MTRAASFLVIPTVLAIVACGDDSTASSAFNITDRPRHARFTSDGNVVVYYRQDERPGAIVGIFRVDLGDGNEVLVQEAILAGLDVHPTTDLIVFAAAAAGVSEPDLWTVELDGTGLTRITRSETTGLGYRWPSWSSDGSKLAWEARRPGLSGLDTVATLWMAEWHDTIFANARTIAPGRRSSWRPDGAALVVERRRPGGALPPIIAIVDTSGTILDTLGFGNEPWWRPDGVEVAYLADREPDRGCTGVCFVAASGGTPRPLEQTLMTFPGSWRRDVTEYVYARLMRMYELEGAGTVVVEESRLWIRTLATGADRQLTF